MVLGLKPKKRTEEDASCLAAMQCAGRFYKIDVDDDKFWKSVGRLMPGLGARARDLARVARHFKLKGALKDGATLRQLEYLVNERRIPVIAEVHAGDARATSKRQFITIDHVGKERIRYASPEHSKIQTADRDDFLRNWFAFNTPYLSKPEDIILRRLVAVMPQDSEEADIFNKEYRARGRAFDRPMHENRTDVVDYQTAAASLSRILRDAGEKGIRNRSIEQKLRDVREKDILRMVSKVAKRFGFEGYEDDHVRKNKFDHLLRLNADRPLEKRTRFIVEWWDGKPMMKGYRHFSLVEQKFEEDGQEYISFWDSERSGLQTATWADFRRNWFSFTGSYMKRPEHLKIKGMLALTRNGYDK